MMDVNETDVKPSMATTSGQSGFDKMNDAAQCVNRAYEALSASPVAPREDVDRHLSMALELIGSVGADFLPLPPQVDGEAALKAVLQAVTTLRRGAERLLADRSDRSSTPSSASQMGRAGSASGTPGTPPQDMLSALRRHVAPAMGLSSLAGVAQAKQSLTEAVVMPMHYPQLFTGACTPWQSVLLFGPPGTGKTRLALAVAAEVGAELYAITPADMFSSWFGETEQNIRALFAQLRERARRQRVIVFLDEVDGLCRRRTDAEPEATRRVKTALLTQLQGGLQDDAPRPLSPQPSEADVLAVTQSAGQLFFICATNCPWEIDPAFLRRFQKRIFIGLPDRDSRQAIIRTLSGADLSLEDSDWLQLLDRTEGFSGSDLADLVKSALYQPVREVTTATYWVLAPGTGAKWMPCSANTIGAVHQTLQWFPPSMVCTRKVSIQDFYDVIAGARRTVCMEDLARYEHFTNQFGQMG